MRTFQACCCLVLSVFILGPSACSRRIPDSELRTAIILKLSASESLGSINVSVQDGIVNLSGEVQSEADKAMAISLARIDGVKEVKNYLTVVAPTPEPETEIVEDEPQTWNERARAFLDDYLETRIVQCGDSYFVWVKQDGLYETKTYPEIQIGMERTFPGHELTPAERLNGGKEDTPETWDAQWNVKISGPWRSYSSNRWNAWRDDPVYKGDNIRYDPKGEFVVDKDHGDFLKLSEPNCSDGDVDIATLMGKGGGDGSSKTITVLANKDGWTDSGIVVHQGQMLNITTSGKWSIGDGNSYDAAGSKDFSGNAFTGGVKLGGLVAKIAERNYEWGPGTSWSGTAQGDGRLIFRMNDLYEKYADNKGAIKVTIVLSP